MKHALLAIGLIFGVAAHAAAAAEPGLLEIYVVTRPGVMMAERRSLPPSPRTRDYCATAAAAVSPGAPVMEIRGPDGYGSDTSTQAFAWFVMNTAAAWFGAGDDGAATSLIDALGEWARAGALRTIRETGQWRSNTGSVYSLRRTLIPLLSAWSVVRGHDRLKTADRRRIEDWLEGLVRLADVETGGAKSRPRARDVDCATVTRAKDAPVPVSNCQNHRYLRDTINMQWGILTGDDKMFQNGVGRLIDALRQMRPDGSLPLETERGARALWYSRHAIGSLVFMAEMAALQGYDLYSLRVNGVGLHTAVAFLMAAIEDPGLVIPYARADHASGPARDYRDQDLGFLSRRKTGRHYMAWAEPYMARFPEHENSGKLRNLLGGILSRSRPLIDEYAGGNATCFLARELDYSDRVLR